MNENLSKTNTYALLIGNNNYLGNELNNAVNDAEGIKEMFDKLGYKTDIRTNFKRDDIAAIKENLKENIKNIEIGIFYFAGHAFEIDNKNYIAPIDCPFSSKEKSNCTFYCMTLDEIIEIFDKSTCQIKIIILDACRNNPFKGTRGIGACTLAPIKVTKGYIIAYSTSPGETALDNSSGPTNHGVYASAFISHLEEKHLPVENFFKKVRETVYSLTEGKQVSWEHTSLIGDFCFNKGGISYKDLPYSEEAIKDYKYKNHGSPFDDIINGLKSYDWGIQKEAITKIAKNINADINEQFVLGRNILQASDGNSYEAQIFIDKLDNNIKSYTTPQGDNHILNGILYEIYFNSRGEFRTLDNAKCQGDIDKIFSLQYNPNYKKSFLFISDLLAEYQDSLYYVPNGASNNIISITVTFSDEKGTDIIGNSEVHNVINKISVGAQDITKKMRSKYTICNASKEDLTLNIAKCLVAYSQDIAYNPEIPDKNLYLNLYSEVIDWSTLLK